MSKKVTKVSKAPTTVPAKGQVKIAKKKALPSKSHKLTVGSLIKKTNVEDDESILDEEVWAAINSFFEENGLNSAQIQSFNDLIYHKIHRSVEHLKHLKIEENGKCYKVEFGELVFHPPQFTETDDTTHTLYPMEALWRNITYASEIYLDVTITPPTGEATLYEKIYIGNLPVMVKSDLCNISGIVADKEKLARHSEDLFDHGGYFVIAPKNENAAGSTAQRRVLIPQERAAPNRVFIFSNRKDKPKYKIYAEIRSTGNGIHTTTTTVGYINQKISCILPWIDSVEIPLGVLFRALGVNDEQEMALLCIGPDYTKDKEALDILVPTLEYSYECDNQSSALHFIGKRGRKFIKEETEEPQEEDGYDSQAEEKELAKQDAIFKDRDDAVSYATHLLAMEFLPHVGRGIESFPEKAKFLGYMVGKEISVLTKRRDPEDRDHVMNKVVITTGALLAQQFYGAFRRMTTEIINNTRKALRNGHTVNITSWIKPNIITNAMHGAISTNAWNNGGSTSKGISQLYEQFNFTAGIANMRKLSVPMAAEGGKSIAPRDLHQSHIFIICPAETPEGKNAGLVKNLAMTSFVTVDTDPVPVKKAALALLGDRATKEYPASLGWTKIFLNGALIGETDTPTEFVRTMTNLRRHNELSSQTSISYFAKTKEIYISTEAGRLARPLFIVKDGALTFKLSLVKKLLVHEMTWTELLATGTVELIDKCEEESCNIAGYPSDFDHMSADVKLRYTHCELHPSLIFGIGGSIIPFPDHNQSPRNTYQCLWKEEPVLMGDGTWKKIKDVVVGDNVVTFNPDNSELSVTKVIHAHVSKTQKRIVKIVTKQGHNITVTDDHKIFTLRGWVEAGKLVKERGYVMQILDYVAVYHRTQKTITYDTVVDILEHENVEIADITTESENHSFIGGSGICVHNSAMGKQAIGIPFTNYRQMMSGTFHTMAYLQKPLALSRAASIIGFDEMPAGQNAMVAVLPRPFNEEDSIEINQDSIDRGFMVSYKWMCYYAEISDEKNEFFGIPTEETCIKHRGDSSKLCSEGYPKPGTTLKEGDVVIGKMVRAEENDEGTIKKNGNKSLIYEHAWPSVVDSIQTGTTGDGYEYIRVMVCQRREPVVGDKFAARHGQKGTVGAKPRAVDLPFTRNGGMVPDIIMNSLAYPSRMTIAMLVEIWTGKTISSSSALHDITFAEAGLGSGGMDADDPIPEETEGWAGIASDKFKAAFIHPNDSKIVDATPFRKTFSVSIIRDEMKKYGLEFADEYMYDGVTGKLLKALVFFGPGYYQKLKHMVIDKMHARARGGRTTLTRQPKEGRAAGGGLRIGCMERDCILGQGAARFGRDRLMEQSDEFRQWVCDICGLPAHVEKEGTIKECRVCGTNKVSWIRLPYGTKLIMQEMMAMNIVSRTLTNSHTVSPMDDK